MEIPIEIFTLGIAVSIALGIFGFIRNPQVPAMMAFCGIFFLFLAITTDSLIMGYNPRDVDLIIDNSTQIVDTPHTPIQFQFTELPKVFFSLLGTIFILSGALMIYRGEG